MGMDVAIEVLPRTAVVTFGAERAVVILSVEIIVKLALDSPVVERDKDSGEVCVLSEMGEATEITSGLVLDESKCERVVFIFIGFDILVFWKSQYLQMKYSGGMRKGELQRWCFL